MSKSTIKFYLVPGVIALVILAVILIIPFGKENKKSSPTPTSVLIIPTIILPTRPKLNTNISPTLLPIQEFTGAEINQELPSDVRDVGIQKTSLRRQVPLTLEFGVITFDYENDQFTIILVEPKEQSENQLAFWLTENYPALTLDKFAFQ